MSVEFIRDILTYERIVGEGEGQTMIGGEISIGDNNPDILNILCIDGRVLITGCQVSEEKVLSDGKMIFDVLYATKEDQPSIGKMEASMNFGHSIQVPGAGSNMLGKVKGNIEHIEYELISDKKIKVNAVVNLKGIVYDIEKTEVISDIKGPEIQILRDISEIDEFVSEDTSKCVVKGKVEIPPTMEEVKEILTKDIHIHKKDIQLIEGKIVVNACAFLKILYVSKEKNLFYIEQDIPFTSEVGLPGLLGDMKGDVSFNVEDMYEEIKDSEEGERRVIEVEVVVDVKGKAYEKRTIQNIIDAYSPDEKYDFERKSIKSSGFYGAGDDSISIKERISLSEEAEEIDKLKHVIVKPVVTEYKMVEGKVVVEGVLHCTAIYSTSGEAMKDSSYEEEIPFKITPEILGATIDMVPEVEVNVGHLSYEKASLKEIEIKVILECYAKAYFKFAGDFVFNAEKSELPENIKNMPGIVIYVVQPKDTLWKIAKKYYTAIEDIMEINDIEDQDKIETGMKLLVPKKNFIKK